MHIKKSTFSFAIILIAVLVFLAMPISVSAETVVPSSAYKVTGTAITGIDETWINNLPPNETIAIVIPATINTTDIRSIANNAFKASLFSSYADLRVTRIDLSGATNLMTIGNSAFYNDSGDLYVDLNVETFILPDNIESIGDSAFRRQSGLKGELRMPDSLINMGNGTYIFQGCTGFTSLDLNQVKTIDGGYVFLQCRRIKSINLRSVQSLGNNTFSSCDDLEGILKIPASLTKWGDLANSGGQFSGCGTQSNGFTVEFPETNMGIETIPYNTFSGAKVIGDLVIPEGIVNIGNNAFSNGNSFSVPITSVTLPSTIRSIGNSAFNSCTSLAEIVFPDSLSVPGAKLTLGNNAFQYLAATVLTIPDYVSSLGTQCFRSTQLTTVYLNASYGELTFASGNSPFYQMPASAVIIAKDATEYTAWLQQNTSPFKPQLTYELPIDFCDPTTEAPIASMTPLLKLYNKALSFEKNTTTGAWKNNTGYTLPAVPAEYPNADGWSFAKTGVAITAPSTVIVLDEKLYPASPPAPPEYVWFGQYQQTLIKGPIDHDDPPDGEEGIDYVTLLVDGATPSYRYYKIEPIRWRILEQDNDTYTLISESILDGRIFSIAASGDDARWSVSDMRAWLNGSDAYADNGFYDQAFSTRDAALIDLTTLSDVGTADKVYLPDYATMFDPSYFPTATDRLPDYQDGSYGDAKMKVIVFGSGHYKYWWLRTMLSDLGSPYTSYHYPLLVNPTSTSATYSLSLTSAGVRPMVTITLTDEYSLTHEGTYSDPYVLTDNTTIAFDDSTLTKTYGDAPFAIDVTLTPSTSTSQITYTFSEEGILSYDSNTDSFIILSDGIVTVTATLPNGNTANCVVTVNKATPDIDLDVSPDSVTVGQNATLTATLTGPTGFAKPTGSVEFFADGTSIGTGTVTDGVASITVNDLAVKELPYDITATYTPANDAPYNPVTSTESELTVNKATPGISLDVSPNSITFGQNATLTATLTGPTGVAKPTGSVEFFADGTSIGTGTVTDGVASITVNDLAVQALPYAITATYTPANDAPYNPVTSTESELTVNKATPGISLDVSPSSVTVGQNATLTATLTGPTGAAAPTGSVEFFADGVSVGTGTVTDGVASIQINQLAAKADPYSIIATYTPANDASYNTVDSAPQALTVRTPPPSDPTYTVTFDAQGGSAVPSQSVKKGNKVTKPTDPTKSAYIFTGWYTDKESSKSYNFDTTITASFTLYAGWEEDSSSGEIALNKEDHFAYMIGDDNGAFHPDADITRAETAQMIYNLLLDKNQAKPISFSDVSSDSWYYVVVTVLASKGVLTGYPDGTFWPEEPITRAEFVTVLSRLTFVASGGMLFSDVSTKHWAYVYIVSATTKGWIDGYDDGTFRPDQSITRAEAAKVINALLERSADKDYVDAHPEINRFPDVDDSHWAYDEIMEATVGHEYTKDSGKETWKVEK